MKRTDIDFYADMAERIALRSYCIRKKVGALIVSSDGEDILGYGYNGTPRGFENRCEDRNSEGELINRPEVLHAELNAIAKCAKRGKATEGASMFVTLSPCMHCALLILQAGIKEIYYNKAYSCSAGLKLLQDSGVEVYYVGNYENV